MAVVFTNLSPGTHQLSVQTTDNNGIQSTSVFSWTIIPISTIITAVDGNNAPVQNGGTTSSTSIKFTFTTTGGVAPYTYVCAVDGAVSSCPSTVTFTSLPPG